MTFGLCFFYAYFCSDMLVSSSYFPPILQYAWMLQSPDVTIEQFETFPKQTFRNRCSILTANGVQSLTVPVIKPNGAKSLTRDIKVAYETPWQKLHLRALKTAYNSSPFLLYYQNELEAFYQSKPKYLLDLNDDVVRLINELMEWELITMRNESFVFPSESLNEEDKRYSLSPKDSKHLGLPHYIQVFSEQFPFKENLSILDLILNLGPEAEAYLMKL